MRLWYNDQMKVVWLGPNGPIHLSYIDVPDGTPVLPGDEVSMDTLTLIARQDTPERLARAQSIQLARISQKKNKVIENGFPYNGHTWDTDPRSMLAIAMQAIAIVAGASLPTGFAWLDSDNVAVPMTAADFRGLVTGIVSFIYQCVANARNLRAQVKATTTVSEVILIDVDVGWP